MDVVNASRALQSIGDLNQFWGRQAHGYLTLRDGQADTLERVRDGYGTVQ